MEILTLATTAAASVAASLRDGKTIVYPTETCYGLGCDAANENAVEKIFAIKGREKGKSVLMIAADIAMVKQYAKWGDAAQALATKYWPGALTIVLPKKRGADLAPGVVGPDQTVAFRVTDHPFARALVTAFGRPIVSTSANLAGGPNPYRAEDVRRTFEHTVATPDILVDAGQLPGQPPSTIVQVAGDHVQVLRQGALHIIHI